MSIKRQTCRAWKMTPLGKGDEADLGEADRCSTEMQGGDECKSEF